jgi:hypothetical protein
VTYQDSICDGIKNCDGSITISAKYGTSPYYYSINNGLTWQTNGLFFGLCPNTYTVLTRDSKGATNTDIVTITYSQQPTTYQISINLLADKTITSTAPNFVTTTNYLTVTSNPPIPDGLTLQFNLDFSSIKTINGPGSGTCVNNIVVYQNDTLTTPFNSQTTTVLGTRPNCNPELQTQITDSSSYSVQLNSLSSVSIVAQSVLTITDGQIGQQSNCVTELEEIIYVQPTAAQINGCTCCSVVTDSNHTPAVSNSVSYTSGNIQPPTPNIYQLNNLVVSLVNADTACSGGDYYENGSPKFFSCFGYGTNIDNVTQIFGFPSWLWSEFTLNQTFYVRQMVNPGHLLYVREFMLNGQPSASVTATPSGAASLCIIAT